MSALKDIYNNINSGKRYARLITGNNPFMPEPFYYTVLEVITGRKGKLIHWAHYGSSCEGNTLKELRWVLAVIFKLTPEEFINMYTLI